MSISVSQSSTGRLGALRAALRSLGIDALVVTHLTNVRYLTGLAATAGAVVVSPRRAVLVVDFRYMTAARELIAHSTEGLVQLEVVKGSQDETIVDILRQLEAHRIGIEATSMTVGRFNRLSGLLAAAAGGRGGLPVLVPTDQVVERQRLIKDELEVSTMRHAARRLSEVARAVPSFVVSGRSEQEIAADIESALRRAGFERPAFETIVASGPNSARPHARPGPRRLQEGDGVVLDFGGVYDGYCVDLTRTLHIGVPDAGFRRLFDAVVEAHAAALAAVRPGVPVSTIDRAARDVLARRGLAEAFGHGTGHGLGLEVHEEPRVTKAANEQTDTLVAAGMVFTIEPGAYVPGVGGVRIEDDVLVVPRGCELLTDVPIELSAPSVQRPAEQ